jgi:hypothetical protein
MTTSQLPNGSVIKFKNPARLHSYYDRIDYMGAPSKHPMDSMAMIDVLPGDVLTVLKTSLKDDHVGQSVLFQDGRTKVIYYRTGTFYDTNRGTVDGIDVTLENYYYDVLEG